ncbi:Cobalamin adenosyltransferase [Rhodovastum atsumiense]|uniref:Corrinoid adenosyltransferase n=1 Tax=Rhodovastum atsumiense TaxID=504468 RepID=A0A5M6IIL1_9PROT|nr:cob(I)yrinic acid a,c-diamide adenosyltransferase [Rhodovastum atsumiense]KAA5608090.1 cob(I)yrinic acid a,c-diamide adenosyltransferase [Rhodovastum atsumiense]CAH2604905.1 Cobalamin adenosyltransferase [Rhodovastum atsumiense]
MVRIDRVITRGGDAGETSLGDGERVSKDSVRVEAFGSVDEANACIGVLRLHLGCDGEADAMLARIQNDLFDVGADLCVPGDAAGRLRLGAGTVERLEREVEAMNVALPALRSFVLPAGTPGATHAHVARTIVRRAERRVVALAREQPINPLVLRYFNRLSDHLFVLARRLNLPAGGDVLWVPEGNR